MASAADPGMFEYLGATLEHFGAILGPCWGTLEARFGHLGGILCHAGVMLLPRRCQDASWRQFGAIYEPSSGHLEAILGSSWAYLGSFWVHVGASWGYVATIVEHLGIILGLCWSIWGHFLSILHKIMP